MSSLSVAKCFVPFKRLVLAFGFGFHWRREARDLKAWFNMLVTLDTSMKRSMLNLFIQFKWFQENFSLLDESTIVESVLFSYLMLIWIHTLKFMAITEIMKAAIVEHKLQSKRFEHMIKCMRTRSQLRSALCRGRYIIWMQIRKPVLHRSPCSALS